MSTNILVCVGNGIVYDQVIAVLGREYRIINTTTEQEVPVMKLTSQGQSFTPPHKKKRRGKFKRCGK